MRVSIEHGKISVLPSAALVRFNSTLTQIHRELGHAYQLLVQQGFEAERSPAGTPWKPLSPATVRRRGNAHPILRVSRRLSRTHLQADERAAVVGSNLVYAAIHQYGGVIERKGGVARLHFKKFRSGPRKGRTLFSKARQAGYGMTATVKPYSIRISARPWLFNLDGTIPQSWQERLKKIVLKHLTAGDA